MSTARVSIVGLGPKGLYCLERLLAEWQARPLRDPLHIDVFNRSELFGAGPIYDPAQPDHILVNNSVGDIDLWTVDDPPIAAGRGPRSGREDDPRGSGQALTQRRSGAGNVRSCFIGTARYSRSW